MLFNVRPMNRFPVLSGALAIAIGLGYETLPARAIVLNEVSGSWSNPRGGTPETIEWVRIGKESQVRWGQPPQLEREKSGFGFTGTGATTLEIGESFLVGQLRHFNNVVFQGTAATAVDLTLNFAFSDPILTSSFNFRLEIEETLNREPCLYPGSTICPDKISFPQTLASNAIAIDSENYTLELLGFSATPDGTPVNQLLSQELGENNSFVYLFARLVEHQSPTQTVPEPGMWLGFSMLGLYVWKSRRSRHVRGDRSGDF